MTYGGLKNRVKIERNLSKAETKGGQTRYIVSYANSVMHVVRIFETLEEAKTYKAWCDNIINQSRLQKNNKRRDYTSKFEEYPENLYSAMHYSEEEIYELEANPSELESAYEFLSDREAAVVRKRYEGMKTLEEVAKEYKVTRERIREIQEKGVKKLKWKIERDKKTGNICGRTPSKITTEEEYKAALAIVRRYEEDHFIRDEKKEKLDKFSKMTIDELDLSVRTTCCLKRAGIEYGRDILDRTKYDLRNIRNLGKRSFDEIIKKIDEYGAFLKKGYEESNDGRGVPVRG